MIRRLTRSLMLSRRELGTLLLLFACSLPAVTARLYSSDEVEYFSYLRSLWFDHDVSFENEYQYFYDHNIAQSGDFHQTFLELTTPAGGGSITGRSAARILWAPFYAVGDGVARAARAAGRDVAVDGYSRPYVAAVAYGSAFYGFAAIVLGIAAARRLVGAGALGSGLAVWLGTPILFYMYIAPPFSHACSAFAVALLVRSGCTSAKRGPYVVRRCSASPAHSSPWCVSRMCSSRSCRPSTTCDGRGAVGGRPRR